MDLFLVTYTHLNLQGKTYPWGGNLTLPKGKHRANIFQGEFPNKNTAADGFEFLAPIGSFEAQNSYGLHDMIGNAWEWVSDWWTGSLYCIHQFCSIYIIVFFFSSVDHFADAGVVEGALLVNPEGPSTGREKTKKGGSFLCHKSYCDRYRNSARHHTTPDSATINSGFRCARSPR